jgi:hypothetical protein
MAALRSATEIAENNMLFDLPDAIGFLVGSWAIAAAELLATNISEHQANASG